MDSPITDVITPPVVSTVMTPSVLTVCEEEVYKFLNLKLNIIGRRAGFVPEPLPANSELRCAQTWEADVLSVVSRPEAEQNSNYKQLIPYVIVVDDQRNDPSVYFKELSVLGYYRTQVSGEQRLRGKLSIGFGGHIDDKDFPELKNLPEKDWIAKNLQRMIYRCATRELEEELGLQVADMNLNFLGYLYEDMTEVGSVHLGLVFMLILDQKEYERIQVQKDNAIRDIKFMKLREFDAGLSALDSSEAYASLELWSKMVMDYIQGPAFLKVLEWTRNQTHYVEPYTAKVAK